jgi:hypothetical protein
MYSDVVRNGNILHGIFEDGWLLYAEFDQYWEIINNSMNNEWIKSEALNNYINGAWNSSFVIRKGFELAKWFLRHVIHNDIQLFRKFSSELALLPYNSYDFLDIHSEIIRSIDFYRKNDKVDVLMNSFCNYSNTFDFFDRLRYDYPVK